MGSVMAEIGVELKAWLSRTTVARYLVEWSKIDDVKARMAVLEDYVRCFEGERQKINAFKRELPLCMQLISDVIEMLKDELHHCQQTKVKEDEFVQLKKKEEEEKTVKDDRDEKKNWSSGLQLWSGSSSEKDVVVTKNEKKLTAEKNEHSFLDSKSLNGGGAFVPFKIPAAIVIKDEKKAIPSRPEISPPIKNTQPTTIGNSVDVLREQSSPPVMARDHLGFHSQPQIIRKVRRCWSPELHRRFVAALQHLGGAQVATPKQIRELMKVDGLTNDEVKSHLQKYRLHTRRAPNPTGSVKNPAAITRGLWGPQEGYTQSNNSQQSLAGSPQSPLQLSGSSRMVSSTTADNCEDDV